MICGQCQAMNEDDSAFCGNCGNSLAGQAVGNPHTGAPAPAGQVPGLGAPASGGQMPGMAAPGAAGLPRPAEPFRIDLRRLSQVEQVVGGASVVVLISLFLPWYGFSELGSSFTISGTSTHGYLFLVLILALAIIAYLILRSGWSQLPFTLPIAHGPLLLLGASLQFLLVLIGFFDKPAPGLDWEIGAYLALLAAVVAAAPLVVPAIRSWQASR